MTVFVETYKNADIPVGQPASYTNMLMASWKHSYASNSTTKQTLERTNNDRTNHIHR